MECVAYFKRVEADAADPLADKASVLACRQMPSRPRRPGKQALTELSPADPKVVVNCLPGRFGEFEANRPAGLALPDTAGHMVIAAR
jgi:hypothetical protein